MSDELKLRLASSLFKRTVLPRPILPPPVAVLHPDAATVFKDGYAFEFLKFLFYNRALGCEVSPALVAEYRTRLPDKELLQAKLHEFYELARQQQSGRPAIEAPKPPARRPPRPGKGPKTS